jgi:hypothetical protein
MVFWDLKKNTRTMKYVKNLIDINSHGAYCVLTAKIEDNCYIAILCNSIGSPVENRVINFEPIITCVSDSHIVLSNKHYVYVWQFRSNQNNEKESNNLGVTLNIDILKKKLMKEIVFYIEDNTVGNTVYNHETFSPIDTSSDPISAIFVNEK